MKKLNVLPYGAVELKRQINSSTVKGFFLSLLFFAFVGLIPSLISSIINDEKDSKVNGIEKTFTVISLKIANTLAQQQSSSENSEAKSKSKGTRLFDENFTEKLIPVDVAATDITPSFDNNQILSNLGDSDFKRIDNDISGDSDNGKSFQNNNIIEENGFDRKYNFKNVEKKPGMDYDKIKSSVVYPTIAREMNLSGEVYVAALIQKDGKLTKSYIYKSSNSLFDKEALKAVNNYNDFSPAIQNERAVECWIIIPIKFRIK